MATAQALSALDDQVLDGKFHEATETFCRLAVDGHPVDDLVIRVMAAAAPYLHVPAHEKLLPNGEFRNVNYDHTILGIRAGMRLAPYLGPKERHLTVVQGVYYVPQGLDVWAQLECGFPGHYAREQERCPEEGLGHELHCHFEDQEPLVEGSVDERFDRMFTAPLVLNPLMARMAEAAGYEELRDGFGGRARKRADWGPAEKAMLDVIDLENLLAIERTTVEKTRNK